MDLFPIHTDSSTIQTRSGETNRLTNYLQLNVERLLAVIR